MTAAAVTDPELLQGPRLSRRGIFHFHLVATPLTADLERRIGHGRIVAQEPAGPR